MSKYGYYLGMTPEQQDIVKMIREFAERELDPVVKEYDEKGEFPVQLHEKWGEMGLFGLDVPEQYGGLGLNAVTRYCISEELAKHDAGFTISNNSYSFGLSAILADGTEVRLTAADLDAMIGAYYQARGWDTDGRVPRGELERLDLVDVAEAPR